MKKLLSILLLFIYCTQVQGAQSILISSKNEQLRNKKNAHFQAGSKQQESSFFFYNFDGEEEETEREDNRNDSKSNEKIGPEISNIIFELLFTPFKASLIAHTSTFYSNCRLKLALLRRLNI